MNEAVEGMILLSKAEVCEAVTMWLQRRMARPLVAVDILGGYDFKVEELPDNAQRYEEETEAEVMNLLRQHKTIDAIRYHRGRTGYGLRESKDHIERIKAQNGL